MAKTKTSVNDAAKSNGSTKAKAADSPKAKPAASPKAKQAPAASPKVSKAKADAPKAKPAASPKAVQQNGAVKKQQQQQQAKRPAAKGAAAKGGQNKQQKKQQPQQQQSPKGPNYFETPALALVQLLVIVGGFALLAGAVFAPNTIPSFLGPIATFAKQLSASYNHVLKLVLVGGIVVHILEGLYAVYLCTQKRINLVPTLKWWIQTTLLGFFSLRLLLKHGSAGGKKKK